MHRAVLMLGLLVSLASPVSAARTQSADQPVVVKLEVNQPVLIVYPEPIVRVMKIDVQINQAEQYGADAVENLLTLAIYHEFSGRLFPIGRSGKHYMVTFRPGTPGDDIVTLVVPTASAQATAPAFSVDSWLRALRTGAVVPGQERLVLPWPTLPDTRVTVVDQAAVALGATVGWVLQVQNTSETAVTLDLRLGEAPRPQEVSLSTWTWPPRLRIVRVASTSGREVERLEPGQVIRLFLVGER